MHADEVKSGWIIPVLRYNMRNQINISNIVVDEDDNSFKMQGAIEKTTSGSTILGTLPLLFKVMKKVIVLLVVMLILRMCLRMLVV